MFVPRRVIVAAAVVAAIPFGWGLGVVAAYVMLGPDFGVFPVVTIPLACAAAIAFAFMPWVHPGVRLMVLTAGAFAFIAFGGLLIR
jgi:hypothetical protein